MMIDRVRRVQVPHRERRVVVHTYSGSSVSLMVRGRQLGDLVHHLCQHRAQTVHEVDPLHTETLTGDAAVVSGIEIAETGVSPFGRSVSRARAGSHGMTGAASAGDGEGVGGAVQDLGLQPGLLPPDVLLSVPAGPHQVRVP